MEYVIELEGISKCYKRANEKVEVIRKVDMKLREGEFLSIMGPSGSGKSTLMNILGCIDHADDGTYRLCGENISSMKENRKAYYRNKYIGFVFQSFLLLPKFSAIENVEMPMLYSGLPPKKRRERAEALLISLGLKDRMSHTPKELSGGQCQRVSIARALANYPKLLLADEPTGNLDEHSGKETMEIMRNLNREGTSIILITHDINTAGYASTRSKLLGGKLVYE